MRAARVVVLNAEQKEALEQFAYSRSRSVRMVERAALCCWPPQESQTRKSRQITAHKAAGWRNRFLDPGLAGLEKDAPRSGRTPSIPAAPVKLVIEKTTQDKPGNATHWSTRSMAAATGLSPVTMRRIWHKHGLKPHLIETFKVSSDPHFAEKLEAIVGLYLNPPEHCAGVVLR